MTWESVLLDTADHVATITLNRPEKLNAFSGMMRQEIAEVVDKVCQDPDTRVIVITGAGTAFCVGGDVNEFSSGTSQGLAGTGPSERPPISIFR